MEKLTQKAKELLLSGQNTCVICRENEVFESTERGVKPLLEFLDSKTDLKDACAADKVVGAGAAFLYVLLGVREVYALVLSERAKAVLEENGVSVVFETLVSKIENRAKNGFCPIETAVWEQTEPAAALTKIRQSLESLTK
ncbi:MAG: DUF1893 domain-containing protein [Oscillospiraceae bacterium]|nr:DUF1893 domain-containing protein [Oscillospiraceae bacterium]